MTSTLPPVVQAISGSIGSATANSLTYPLDLVGASIYIRLSLFRTGYNPAATSSPQ